MKIVIIDNYDSFTYNLSHMVKGILNSQYSISNSTSAEVTVYRNDQFEMSWLEKFDKIILSPGPGIPCEAGQLMNVIKEYAGKKPILGVCLGHQAIGEFFGAKLENLSDVFHGVATEGTVIHNKQSGSLCISPVGKSTGEGGDRGSIFAGLPERITMGRYHSWVVSKENFPDCLEITAESDDGQIMALRHKTYDIQGVQFHPESVLTPDGGTILRNWLCQ